MLLKTVTTEVFLDFDCAFLYILGLWSVMSPSNIYALKIIDTIENYSQLIIFVNNPQLHNMLN